MSRPKQFTVPAKSEEELYQMFFGEEEARELLGVNGAFTEAEKNLLKEQICRMIDRGEDFGLIETAEMVQSLPEPKLRRKTWQVNIRKVITIEP